MATIKDVVDFATLKPIQVSNVVKKTKRAVYSTKQVGRVKPTAHNQVVTTIISDEKKKEKRMYLLALENMQLRKKAFATKKISCMMCPMNCDSEEELEMHEKMAHWCQADNGYFCASDQGQWIKAPYICLTCGGGYPTLARLQTHLEENHNLRFEF